MEIKPEVEAIIERALEKLKARGDAPVILQINYQLAFGIVSQLQLALRHPANVGHTRDITERFVRDLIERLDPERTEVYQVLMMGFDERYDLKTPSDLLEPADDLDWNKALEHFREIRSQYQELAGEPGVNSTLALQHVFQPLAKRYYDGERSQELFDEMMSVK
jgi:hypothetical protein